MPLLTISRRQQAAEGARGGTVRDEKTVERTRGDVMRGSSAQGRYCWRVERAREGRSGWEGGGGERTMVIMAEKREEVTEVEDSWAAGEGAVED